jgi:hypothetical protein
MKETLLQERLILADAHVHIYPRFDLSALLESALKNFLSVPEVQSRKGPWAAFLFLAETKEEDWFSLLSRQAREYRPSSSPEEGKWYYLPTREEQSLYGPVNEDGGLFIIAGRQIKTAENLEILALGTNQPIKEGRPIKELIEEIGHHGALPVIPWGVGKWQGSRRLIIKNLFHDEDIPQFFLGDSRNRPIFWPKPALFNPMAWKGCKNLPGSDPLPLPAQGKKPGSYGFLLKGAIDFEYPFKSIRKLLIDPVIQPVAFGRQESFFPFFWNQFCLRVKGRK